MTFELERNWHKRPTHLTIYAEDMLNHVRSFSRDKQRFKRSLSLLEDRAHGSLFLFPVMIVEQMLKASPIVAYTNFANIDLRHIVLPAPSILKTFPFYQSIQQLFKIIAISNDLLDDLNEDKRISRLSLYELSEVVCNFYDWAFETYPREEFSTEEVASKKAVEENIEWFALLCDHLKSGEKISARNFWNMIKTQSAPEKPICFDEFQVVLHEDKLFYSTLPMTPKQWIAYLDHEEANRIVYKTFEKYLSRYKKNLPNNSTRENSVN
ncbi:hypothetical protein [Maridesulfovibrio frigidus]|uniref:hypothetical protein n=1 Tax=Maridesulfovibrio frigidus TaxID=340956 RepID=UPI0004E224E7|nr:hypothetical protein [Maridesulfovibrio frigidus]